MPSIDPRFRCMGFGAYLECQKGEDQKGEDQLTCQVQRGMLMRPTASISSLGGLRGY